MTNNSITSFRDLIDRWPDRAAFAEAIDVSIHSCKSMVRNNSINPKHWNAVISACKDFGIGGIDHKFLTDLYNHRNEQKKSTLEAA